MSIFDGFLTEVKSDIAYATKFYGLTPSPDHIVGIGGDVSLPSATPSAPMTTPFVGPLLLGQSRPAPRPMPTSPAPAVPAGGTFNMIEDAMSKIPGLGSVTDFFGLTPTAPAASSSPTADTAATVDHSAEASSWAHDLTRWCNILKSLDRSMNARDGASDLSAKYRAWESGPYTAALSQAAALQNGHADYNYAQGVYTDAISQAKALQGEIQDRWSQFAASGAPTATDYLTAIPHGAADTFRRGVNAAERAGEAIEGAAKPLVSSGGALLKYGPWVLGGLAVLYVSSFLPRSRRDF